MPIGANGPWITNYIFSLYTDEQRLAFQNETYACVSEGIMHSLDDTIAYDLAGTQPVTVNTFENKFTIRYLLIKPELFCERFVNDWDPSKANNMAPIQDYFNAHPEEGSYSFKVIDDEGVDVTPTYYDAHKARYLAAQGSSSI
jgi:hypothetical protein